MLDKEEPISKDPKTEEKTESLEGEETTDAELEEILKEESVEEVEEAGEVEEIEEIKPRKKKEKAAEEEFVEERYYTIPLGRAYVRPPKKRAPRAMQLIKVFLNKHMKLEMRVEAEEERGELPQLIITNEVNEKVWGRSIEKPPRKIRVRAAKDKEGNVTVFLAEGE